MQPKAVNNRSIEKTSLSYLPEIPVDEVQKVENQILKYYRFKIYWKQVAIKKYLEEHMGIKSSKLREIKKLRLQESNRPSSLIYQATRI